jgi:hypothetical protein
MPHAKTLIALSIVAALFFLTGVQVFSYAQNESAAQNREQAKQNEGEAEQAKTGAEEQALAGTPEATNMTNATMANVTSAGNMTGNMSG